MSKVFYYDREKALNGELFLLGIEDKVLQEEDFIYKESDLDISEEENSDIKYNFKKEYYKNSVIYIGDMKLNGYPIVDGNSIRAIPIPDGILKPKLNNNEIIEGATEEEITEHMGVLVTKLLYDVMAIGCEVTIKNEKHQQILDDDKRKALNERISGFNLAKELGSQITQVAWPFKDDGTDTVVMSVDEFKQMALYCLGYGEKCYLAAELLKAKRKVNSTIDDFYNELKNVDGISLENL